MAIELSAAVRNARLDAIETTIGTAPVLRILTGAVETNLGDADSGTLLAELTLPSDWMAAAASGAKAKSGTWQDTSANASGTPGHFRLLNSGATTVHMQGTCGVGSGDLSFDTTVSLGGTVTVSTFTLTDGNAD
jgi:hypothetical protein